VLCQLARYRGMASFVYMPENEGYLRENIRRIWRNDETFEDFCERQCFIQSSRPEHYREEVQTIDWVLDQAVTAIKKDHVEMVVIDPFNELEWSKRRDEAMTDYIRECLKLLKQFTRAMDVVTVMIAHPTKAVHTDGGRVPSLYDIENSASWFNKCDNGLIVYREKDAQNVCRLISAKVREIGAGKRGECFFNVDPETGVFAPADQSHGG
jgi:twinkle protein